jgi:NADH-quinone oxidoreductase subunit A
MPGRYYSIASMSNNHLEPYAPLLIHVVVAAAIAGVLVLLSSGVGRRRPTRAKLQAYECGMIPTGDAREPFSVKFYLVGMIFILFDVEAIFLFPWALVYTPHDGKPGLGLFGFVEMMLFIVVVLVGYFYLWKKGALDWTK